MPSRSVLLRLSVAALCLAAAAAIVALLLGSFSDTDIRVVLTSLAFAVLSATAASGVVVRQHGTDRRRALGGATVVVSAATFVMLTALLWEVVGDSEGATQFCGVLGLTAVALSHASLVTSARRTGDSRAVERLATASLALAAFDWLVGFLLITGAGDPPDGSASLIAVTLVLLVLTSLLPPILRRLDSADRPAAASPRAAGELAGEVLAAADRIDAVTREAEVRRETARLREIVRDSAP